MLSWSDAAEAFSRRFVTICSCGGVGFVRTNAPNNHPLFGKPIPCVCKRDGAAKDRANRLRRLSGLSKYDFVDLTFARFDPRLCQPGRKCGKAETIKRMREIKGACERYAAKPEGWLILVGNVGTGKSHLARAVAQEAMGRGMSVHARSMPDVLDMLREGYKDNAVADFTERLALLQDVELLILDDLGAEKTTDWAAEQLFKLVNHRYDARRPMVVTSNVHPAMVQGLDARIRSRLTEGAKQRDGWARVLTLPCGDFRPMARRR